MFYIWEAAVTDFYGAPVEDFAQFVVLRKVLVDQGEEDFGNIGGYIDVEGGILKKEPKGASKLLSHDNDDI